MKKILILFAIFGLLLGCDDEENQLKDDDKAFTLEGTWYISGRSGIYKFENDTVSFNFNENVLGYEEHTFSLVEGKKNEYTISTKMKYLQQNVNESDEDYCDRIENGRYSIEDLVDINISCPQWVVSGNEIIIPGRYFSSMNDIDDVVMFKFIKKSKDQFVIISATPTIVDLYIEDPLIYQYYLTFNRTR